ncbi:LacI family DNA-binding transcriptional regulator [Sphaerisporangium corydalis]|uniref:LacI family DNA-binding transcriptional regulator n=1 Tax=Sphaerisporangium corydalis TaxID=1441875 RepID=A0ABV9E8F0_9ACTN|nr:LacI family DNA-binding transcriptional regulator [Sphaerisporangium corydalis]
MTTHSAPLTIAEIAELADVSVSTVSKVVNGKAEVSPSTRTNVERIIERYGYRRQRKQASRISLVELVFHELEPASGYAMEIIAGVEETTRRHKLSLVLSHLQGRQVADPEWFDGFLHRRPSGLIAVFSEFSPGQREQLRRRNIPLVLVDPRGEPGHDMPSVGAGNWNGGLTATRHLLGLGHRRIAIITGPPHLLSARARLDGYRAAMDQAGAPVDPSLVREARFLVEDGFEHTLSLLALPDPPTAIFASDDGQAMGVYQAVARMGLRVPGDVSVVGFDDLTPAQWVTPPLTTVRQPLREMGTAAASMVVALARNEPLPHNRLIFTTDLVVRGSTAEVPPPDQVGRARSAAPASQ